LEAIEEHFSKVSDPRIDRSKEHKLIDIIAIAICAVICGAEGWVDIELFGKSKLPWLKSFLELPNGIPSHDTFGRVFSMRSNFNWLFTPHLRYGAGVNGSGP
jgi:hypothetical protein